MCLSNECGIVFFVAMNLCTGVFVRMRAASRVSVRGVCQGDPYVIVSASEYLDEETVFFSFHARSHTQTYACTHRHTHTHTHTHPRPHTQPLTKVYHVYASQLT